MIELCILFLPLFGAVLGGIVNRPLFAQALTTTLMSVSAVFSWIVFFLFKKAYHLTLLSWIKIGALNIEWGIYIDQLTIIMLVVVTTVSAVVHFYSLGYMEHEAGRSRFFAYLSLFTFFMIVLVVSNNFLQMFVGWEGVGLCSYLLIGFWFQKFSASKAAMKAFVVNRVGDFCLLVGIFLIFWNFGTLDFNTVFKAAENSTKVVEFLGYDFHVVGLICVFLFIGCMGKSAQLGLHVWLPDAMEGPTPVSALIHAATMVTAGVFLVVRCSPLFELSDAAREMMLIVGSITTFFAATVAIAQVDLKKVIAYSTCSQLGYMFIACGVSAYNIAIFHLMTHAFFKALLFLCAGNVIHSMNGQQDIRKMGFQCWRKIPYTYILMFIGSLSISGIFPLAGYYSKDLIIEHAYLYSNFGFWSAILVVFLTSLYSWRLMILVFHSKLSTKFVIHESPRIMLIPLFVLALGAVFAGIWGQFWIELPSFWQGSHVPVINEMHNLSALVKILPTIFSLLGIWFAYVMYYRRWFKSVKLKYLTNFCQNKWYFDEIYGYLFVKPVSYIADFLWKVIDLGIIDAFGPNGIMKLVDYCAKRSVKLQTGYIFDYAFMMLLGLLYVVFWVIYLVISKI